MNTGLSLELLLQIFVVLEGLTLWKISVPSKEAVVDSEQCCDVIWQQSCSARQRSKEVADFLTTEKRYNRSVYWATFLCSYSPLAIFLISILALSVFCDVKQGCFQKGMTFSLLCYLIIKIVVFFIARHYSCKYDKLLEKYTPVNSTTKPGQASAVD